MKITLVQQSRTTAKGWKYRQVSPVMRPFILDSLVKSLMAATPGGRSFRMLHLSAQQDFLGCALGASSWHCGDSVQGFGPRNDPSRPRPRRHGAVPLPFAPATRAFVGSFPTVLGAPTGSGTTGSKEGGGCWRRWAQQSGCGNLAKEHAGSGPGTGREDGSSAAGNDSQPETGIPWLDWNMRWACPTGHGLDARLKRLCRPRKEPRRVGGGERMAASALAVPPRPPKDRRRRREADICERKRFETQWRGAG